jgi:hypothetical protein
MTLALAALLLAGASPPPPAIPPGVEAFATVSDEPPALLLERLAALLPGTYDSGDLPGGGRLTTRITPLEGPDGRLFHIEEWRDGTPAKLVRVRLYRLAEEAGRAMLHVLNPRDMAAARVPAVAARLGDGEIEPDRPACALRVSGLGGQMVARMASRACRVGGQWVDYELLLDADRMTTCHARRTLADDRLVWLQMPPHPCIGQARLAHSSAD